MTTLKTHWPVHPVAELFPIKTPEERAEMKKDMRDRADNGLEPLESPILLWDDRILDGRHRDEIWMELAEEKACGGYFGRMRPPTEEFKPGKHSTLTAWMRAKSRNMMVRQTPADQRAAIFLKAVNAYPELKAVLDGIKEENIKRKMKGQPLGAGDQRGNTNKEVAMMANVGTTTMKQVKQLEKEAPDKFEEVAKGKTTAKKALKEVKEKKRTSAAKKDASSAESVGGFLHETQFLKGRPMVFRLLFPTVESSGLPRRQEMGAENSALRFQACRVIVRSAEKPGLQPRCPPVGHPSHALKILGPGAKPQFFHPRILRKTQKDKTPKNNASAKAEALTCTAQLVLLPTENMTLEEIANRLRMGKAEIRGLHVWLKSAKTVAVDSGTSLPKGCLAAVTGIREAKGFKLEA